MRRPKTFKKRFKWGS